MSSFRRTFLCSSLACAMLASPATAQTDAQTQLVRCGEASCLQVSGYRPHSGLEVVINGRLAEANGDNRWRVRLTLDTVRQLAKPRARSLTVALRDPETQHETQTRAQLPIGLLGDISALESLEVTAP